MPIVCIHVNDISQLCFCFGQIRTLVVMATYIFHRLIIGKVEIDIFFRINRNI